MEGIFLVGRFRTLRQVGHAVAFALLACLVPSVALAQFSIARVSSPVFYRDANMPALTAMYVGYAVTNTSGSAVADVWAGIGNFTGGVVSKAANEDGVVHLGPMSAGQTKMAYFYLNSSGTTAVAQGHTVSIYITKPPGTAAASANFSITSVTTAIEAQANKVTTIVTGPTPPVLGGVVTMTVTGETGTIGSGNMMAFSPAGYPDWDASAFELYQMTLTLSGSANAGVVTDSLIHFVSSSSNTNYQIVYLFRATNVTSAPTSVSPVGYISSGAQTKHTTTNNYGSFPQVQQPSNFITLNKSASPNRMAPRDTVLYTVDLVNTASTALDLDDITDLLPSGASYITGSSTYQGSAIANPTVSSQQLTWNRVFTVPANATAHLTYRVVSPLTPGVYNNSVVAYAGAVQVDHTLLTSDNSPATALIGVGDAEVSVAKFATPSPAVRGQQLTYRIVATNNGPNASGGTTVVDTLPAGLGFVSASTTAGTVSQSGGIITAALGSQASGAHDTVTVVVTVNTSSTLVNRAHADGLLRDLTPSNNVTTLSTTVLAPDVSLDKRHTVGFQQGLSGDYMFVVHNLGTYAAGALTVRDTLPAGLGFTAGSGAGWSFATSGNIVTATHPGPLAIGDSLSFGLQVSVGPAAVPGVTNSAVVSTVGDSNGANDRDSDVTAVAGTANLVLDKRHTSDFVEGTNGSYHFVVRNLGTGATVGEIAVFDTLPAGLAFVSGSGTGWTLGEAAGVVSATHAGPLAVGDSLTFDLTVSVADAAVPAVTNHAFVSGGGDLTPDDNGDSDATTVIGAPDLSLDKVHNGGFRDGSNGSYDFILWNVGNGPTTGTLTVVDTLPAGLTFVSGKGKWWTVNEVGGIVTATYSHSLVAGDSASFTITVAVGTAALPEVSNSATVSATNDTDASNDRDTDAAVVDGRPDLALAKSHTADFHENLEGVYTLVVRNIGDGPTIGEIAVVDSLPDGMTFVAGEGDSWAFVDHSGIVTATHPGPLAVGDSLSFTLRVGLGHAAVPAITNTAVASTADDSDSSNDRAADATTVIAAPDLAVDKRHAESFTDGMDGVYTVAVLNLGDGPTTGTITVQDTLPVGLSYVSAEGTGWNFLQDAAVVTATFDAALAAGDSASFTLTVHAAREAVPGVTNNAVVSTVGDGNASNNRDADATEVVGIPDLALDKRHEVDFEELGTGVYSLVLTNIGSGATSGEVAVRDSLPEGLAFVSGAGRGWSFAQDGAVVTATHAGPIAAGDSLVCQLTVDVAMAAFPGVMNIAVASGGGDTSPENNQDSDFTTVTGRPDLALDKRHSSTFVDGTNGEYDFSVLNIGHGPTTGTITVVDTLPDGLTFVGGDGLDWTFEVDGAVVTASHPGPIASGDSLYFNLTVGVGMQAVPEVTNSAVAITSGDADPENNRDSDATHVHAMPDLALDKRHTGPFTDGYEGAYTFVVRNLGHGATVGTITVRDTLPDGLRFVRGEGADWAFDASGGVVTATTARELAVGDSMSFDLAVDIASAAVPGVINSAVVSVLGDSHPANDRDSDETAVVGAPDLALTKTHAGHFVVGSDADYRLVVRNVGTASTVGYISVTDTLAVGLAYLGGSGAGWTFHSSGRVVTASHPGPIAVDDSLVFTIRVNVGSMTNPIIISSAEVSGGGDVRSGNNRDSDPAAVDGVPDLKLDKRHLAGLVTGVDAQYGFMVTNVGTSATSGTITVVDTLPVGLGFVSAAGAQWSFQNAGQVVTATTSGSVAEGDSLGFTLTVSVGTAAMPSVTNAAFVSGGGDNNPANDRDEDLAIVNGSIDLAVEMRHEAMFEVGQPASWHVVVRNLGTVATTGGYVVSDTLPVGVTYAATTGPNTDFLAQGVHVSWVDPVLSVTQQPGLAPGDSATFDVHVLVNHAAPASMVNRAVVSTVGDLNPANDVAVDPTAVHHTLAASLRMEKRANRDRVELGDAVDYEVVLVNDGDGVATATSILDRLPLGFQYQPGTARLDGAVVSDPAGSPGPELTFPVGTVAAGGTHRLSYRALVGVGAPLGTGINSAYAVATGPNAEAIASPVATARVAIQSGAFSDLGVIAGKVFADRDCGSDGQQGAEDIGIPGVRVMLETGEAAITDIEGKYSFNHVRPRLHVVRVDESTLPAGAALAAGGTRHAGVGRSQFVDLKAGEYHRADFLEVSRSEAVLAEIRERRSQGEVTQAAASAAPSQASLQVTGMVEARKEFRSLSNTELGGGPRDAFEDRLMDARVEDGRGRGCTAGRGALLVTGEVGNGMHLTGRFDSENDRERLMFRDLRPFDGYDLMGDASIHEAATMSDSRLFVRLEKQGAFAQYGDFQTPNRENQRLGAMDRSVTGALTQVVGPRHQVSGFVTEGTSHQVVDELPGMGISGPYTLSRNDGTMGSERVEVVVRDRNQPTRILSRQGMTRFTDYTIEPFTGRLLFRRPVPSVDPDLNPVSVRVTYEAESAGEAFWTYGATASVKADSVITLGVAASRDEDPARPTNVASLDAQFALPRGMRLAAELAHSDSGSTIFDGVRQGEAWRAEFTVQQERLNGRVHASHVEASFDNPSAGVIAGREEMGASMRMTLDSLTQGFVVGLRSESLLNHGRRDGLEFGVSRRLSTRWSGDVSYRWAKESAAPASDATLGATPNQTGSLGARLSAQLPGQRPGRVFGEFEQDLAQSTQQRWALGGELGLASHTHLYARHENIASFAGPFALNTQQEQARTVVGLSSDAGRDGHTFTEYRARDAFAGRETEAAFGLRNRWQVREGTWLDGSLERIEPLSGPDSTRRQGEATSVTGAVEWVGHPLWKATGRLEFRDAANRDQWLGTLGASRKLNRDWSALGHATWLIVPAEDRTDRRTQLGIAYRQTEGNTVNLLARWENRLERSHPVGQSLNDRGANLITALVNVKPATRWTLTGRVATRWMTDVHDDLESHTTTHLFYSRVLVDLNDMYDLGLTGRVMTSADLSQRRTGMGGEIGVMAVKGLRLAGGYNVFGFKDELGTDRSDHGPYLSLGVKFDEADLGLGQKQGGR